MEELAALLSRERFLLEVLVFKLTSLRLTLSSGDTRFLAWAAAEVEHALGNVREAELVRSMEVARLAASLDVPEHEVTLGYLAEHATGPWAYVFADHRNALLELVAEVQQVTEQTRRLAHRGLTGVEEILSALGGQPDSPRFYGPAAHATTAPRRSIGLDRAL